jgi:hypothetical protein
MSRSSPVAVREVVDLMARSVAGRMNMDPEEAIHLVLPEAVGGTIAAAEPGRVGAEHVYAVRPVRADLRTVRVPVRVAGRLVRQPRRPTATPCSTATPGRHSYALVSSGSPRPPLDLPQLGSEKAH